MGSILIGFIRYVEFIIVHQRAAFVPHFSRKVVFYDVK